MVNRKANTTLYNEGKEITANIVEKCDDEKGQKYLTLLLSK
jgi:hypothetical protein